MPGAGRRWGVAVWVVAVQSHTQGWQPVLSMDFHQARSWRRLVDPMWKGGRMDGWVGEWVGGWMGGWVGGWVDGGMDGWLRWPRINREPSSCVCELQGGPGPPAGSIPVLVATCGLRWGSDSASMPHGHSWEGGWGARERVGESDNKVGRGTVLAFRCALYGLFMIYFISIHFMQFISCIVGCFTTHTPSSIKHVALGRQYARLPCLQ